MIQQLLLQALVPDEGRFAEQLEKAVGRSGRVLELRKVEELPPPLAVAVRRR